MIFCGFCGISPFAPINQIIAGFARKISNEQDVKCLSQWFFETPFEDICLFVQTVSIKFIILFGLWTCKMEISPCQTNLFFSPPRRCAL